MQTRQRRQYLTAAHRRRQDPYLFDIDGVELRIVDNIDLAELGRLGDVLTGEVSAPARPSDVDRAVTVVANRLLADDIAETTGAANALARVVAADLVTVGVLRQPVDADTDKMGQAAERLSLVRDAIRSLVHPDYREAFDSVAVDIDAPLAVDVMKDLIAEYSGVNPTSPSASTDSSSERGTSSTDGAQPETSTPSPYQPTESSTSGSTSSTNELPAPTMRVDAPN